MLLPILRLLHCVCHSLIGSSPKHGASIVVGTQGLNCSKHWSPRPHTQCSAIGTAGQDLPRSTGQEHYLTTEAGNGASAAFDIDLHDLRDYVTTRRRQDRTMKPTPKAKQSVTEAILALTQPPSHQRRNKRGPPLAPDAIREGYQETPGEPGATPSESVYLQTPGHWMPNRTGGTDPSLTLGKPDKRPQERDPLHDSYDPPPFDGPEK